MCGIAGLFAFDRDAPLAADALAAMLATLVHRGPDDVGVYYGEGAVLGFRRLSILDLQTGNQPMWAADRSVVSVCNGEIFNHQELRADLHARGCVLHTRCDTEVIPWLYAEYGAGFVSRLRGQFALAVYDLRQRRLVLARDQVGIAPLFFTRIPSASGRQIAFASEIKALLKVPGVTRALDPTGLDQILTLPGVVSPRTLFQNIASVAPGNALLFEHGGHTQQWRYWDLEYPLHSITAPPHPLTPAGLTHVVDELDAALNQAVQRRLQADVPVASYLSGGLDSSLLAAIAAKLQPDTPLSTFSITFPQHEHDESIYQRMMTKALGSQHQARAVTPTEIAAQLRRMVIAAETPLRESYNACSLLLSGMVHDHGMKVVLTGEGADELFGGYVGYRLDAVRHAADGNALDAQLEAELRERLWGDRHLFYERNYLAHNELKRSLYADDFGEQFDHFHCVREPLIDREQLRGRHPLHQRSYLDFKLRMADHLLADHGDRVSFANSVEARYPFLDLDVIDCVRRIPPDWMTHNGIEKYVLKELARRYVPAAIVERPKFSFVAQSSADLLQADPQWLADVLSPARIKRQGYFNPDAVAHLVTTFREPGFQLNQTFEDDLLMIVVTFGILLDEFIAN